MIHFYRLTVDQGAHFSEMRGWSLGLPVISIDLEVDLTDVELHKIVLVDGWRNFANR